tara:strand:- start:11 stop:289 length:279 start_codon:yes stop_codon:yes gene_type:complete
MADTDLLTEREEEVLDLVESYETGLVARKLNISSGTVRTTLHNIRRKRVLATNTVNRLNARTRNNSRMTKLLASTKKYTPKVQINYDEANLS